MIDPSSTMSTWFFGSVEWSLLAGRGPPAQRDDGRMVLDPSRESYERSCATVNGRLLIQNNWEAYLYGGVTYLRKSLHPILSCRYVGVFGG